MGKLIMVTDEKEETRESVRSEDSVKGGEFSCPDCGAPLQHAEGCVMCPYCGWSKCG